jgi:uncharacterized SAM-binding protein YcdF (DUF218 family)
MPAETEPVREFSEIPQHLDALVVLGKNIGVGWTGEKIRRAGALGRGFLSGHAKLNVLAAGNLYMLGNIGTLIFSTGQTSGYPSESQAMKDFLIKNFPKIPDSAIILEEKSIDTAGNAEQVSRIIKENDFKTVGVLSVGFHISNAKLLFQRYGVKVDRTFSSEDVVKNHAKNPVRFKGHKEPKVFNPELFVSMYRNSPNVKKEKKKELIRKFLLHTVDRRGKLIRLVTSRTRS